MLSRTLCIPQALMIRPVARHADASIDAGKARLREYIDAITEAG